MSNCEKQNIHLLTQTQKIKTLNVNGVNVYVCKYVCVYQLAYWIS